MTELQLTLSPEQSADNQFIKKKIAKNLNIETNDISEFKIIRKSIDARGRIRAEIGRASCRERV